VTGVQTCALPIGPPGPGRMADGPGHRVGLAQPRHGGRHLAAAGQEEGRLRPGAQAGNACQRSRLNVESPARADPRTFSERWQSGRMYLTRNQAYVQAYRGFESHPLRQSSQRLTATRPCAGFVVFGARRSEEHTSELQSRENLV